MDFTHLIETIVGVMPFLALCLVSAKINLNKADRSRQFLMPVIALVYCIAGMVLLDYINNWLFDLFTWLSQRLTFLQGISWQSYAIYILNAVLVLGFIAIKGFVLPILSGMWKSNKISEATSGWFYDREEDVDKWLLNPKFANFRGFIKGFYISAFIVYILVFILSQNYPDSIFFQATFYPVFGVLVLGEVVFFLSGMTKSEFVEDILGEDEEAYKVANYGILREILRDLFADRVLYENTCDASDGISTTFEELDEMAQSDDASLKLIGSYYLNLKNSGADIDINYVKSSVNLLNGKSTLFCNPFYRDLTHYIMLPMIKQLISYKKCLIVLGRDSALDDVKNWIDTGLENFSNTDSLWQSQILDEYGNAADVGIVKFCDIHNLKIHKANKDFLSKVGFVLIVEPSRILASGQIGLSLLVNNCESSDKEIVYCACDRNCDGLVDALSHTLKTSITEVTATINGGGNSSQMYWNADGKYMHHKIFPNISRYLGMGTEINAVAMKHQLDQTGWVGCEKFPVVDMKWIAGQYHKQICQYADLPESQASFDRSFNVYSNLWSMEKKENSFLVVEDEFQNLFEITRVFASRAKSQGFINVISENYLLRDYMLDNVDVFTADPKAIPTIVPDYARTERNMVLKLIMLMVNELVSEERIAKELMLCGIPFEDPYTTLKELIVKHCHVEDATLSVRFKEELQSDSLNSIVVKYYEINETNELYEYAQLLKNAYYIAEDEEGESHYIGAKLYGHVFQAMLPGQFMTFDGKYYEVQTVTPLNGVVVRRAADHITERRYYRQIRKIVVDNWVDGIEMGSKRTISDIEITRGYADISVETDGYLDMNSYGNLAKAKKVSLNGIPARNYRNKSVLKIKLPEGTTSRIQYTICLLLNEVFKTTYPETYHYIAALTPHNDEINSENLAYATYQLDGTCEENCIYIVEDSDIDLGLIVSVERNLKRYFEIIADVLNWHSKKMLEPPPEEEEDEEEFVPDFGTKAKTKRKGLLGVLDSVKDFFKKVFGKKKKEGPATVADGKKGPEAGSVDSADGTAPGAAPDGNNIAEGTDAPESAADTPKKKEKKSFGQKIKDFFKKLFGKKKKDSDEADEEETAEDAQAVEIAQGDEEVPEAVDGEADAELTSEEAQEAAEDAQAVEIAQGDEEAPEAVDGEADAELTSEEAQEAAEDAQAVEVAQGDEEVPEAVDGEADAELTSEEAQEAAEDAQAVEIAQGDEEVPETVEADREEDTNEEEADSTFVLRSVIQGPLCEEIPGEEVSGEEAPEEAPGEEASDEKAPEEASGEEISDEEASGEEPESEADIEDSPATEDISGEDEELAGAEGFAPTEYQKKCFVKFGYESIDAVLDIEGTSELLAKLGFDKNPLQQVRTIAEEEDGVPSDYDPHKYGSHLCDFCGVELLGGEYDLLKDGRERCNRCSMTAIKKVDDFKSLYKTVLRNMEAFYGIKLNVAVKVRTTNAKQIAKHVGMKFVPTPGFDGRVLGFAQKDKTGYSLYIENGSPKLAATATIAHELTHIWQYLNWNEAELAQKYGKQNMLEVYEGMAKWAEIQYLMLMNEKSYAKRQEITTLLRNDEYGRGFILYADKYPLSNNSNVTKTPFKENPPL